MHDPEIWPRLRDLLAGTLKSRQRKVWLQHFEHAVAKDIATRRRFDEIEAVLVHLPVDAWTKLKAIILGQIDLRNAPRGWQQAIDLLNEARAYRYLNQIGCTEIDFFAAESSTKTPDLQAMLDSSRVLCEVKTIHVPKPGSDGNLPPAFFKKLTSRVNDARRQLTSGQQKGDVRRIIYIILNFTGGIDAASRIEQIQSFVASFSQSDGGIAIKIDTGTFDTGEARP